MEVTDITDVPENNGLLIGHSLGNISTGLSVIYIMGMQELEVLDIFLL